MFEVSGPINATINTVIAGLPVIAALLLSLNEAKKRRLNKLESWAVYLIFWGFLLFASWENFRIKITAQYTPDNWLLGWLLPLLIAVVFTIVTGIMICQENKKRQAKQ